MATTSERARQQYAILCETLDARNWHYTKHEDNLVVTFDVGSDDLPMDFVVKVDDERQLIRLFSRLPFTFPEDKRVEGAIATCAANYAMLDGSFDCSLTDGKVHFRLVATYREGQLSTKAVAQIINVSCAIVDEYNDKFFAIAKGFLKLEDFLKEAYE